MTEVHTWTQDTIEVSSPGPREPAPDRVEGEGAAAYVAKNITNLREERGWSKTDLARELSKLGREVPRQTIHKMETMQRSVTAEDIWGLARAFNVSTEALFARSNQTPVERLYDLTTDRRLKAVNALAFYRVAQMRLRKAIDEAHWLPDTAHATYRAEATYPYEELQKDSDEIVVAFEIGEDL